MTDLVVLTPSHIGTATTRLGVRSVDAGIHLLETNRLKAAIAVELW